MKARAKGTQASSQGEELETYRTKSLTAKADTAVANENMKVAALNLSDSAVRAPIEGTIQTRTVETGQYVNAGFVMATLLRADPLLLHFSVEPSDAPRLKPGMTAHFTLRESQNTYDAKISLVSAAADPTVHTVQVTAQVDVKDKKYWLRPGSFADVSIDVGATRDAPVIPRAADARDRPRLHRLHHRRRRGGGACRHARHEHEGRLGRGSLRPQGRRAPRRARRRIDDERRAREGHARSTRSTLRRRRYRSCSTAAAACAATVVAETGGRKGKPAQ